jgi:hypothetical protein
VGGKFTHKDLAEISGGAHFKWAWKGAKGHSCGILMGIREDTYEVEGTEVGGFYVSMVLRNRRSNLRWELIIVYGPAQHNLLVDFIAELSRKCIVATLPVVLGVDFNTIRWINEKNNDNVNQGLMDIFNMFINLYQL